MMFSAAHRAALFTQHTPGVFNILVLFCLGKWVSVEESWTEVTYSGCPWKLSNFFLLQQKSFTEELHRKMREWIIGVARGARCHQTFALSSAGGRYKFANLILTIKGTVHIFSPYSFNPPPRVLVWTSGSRWSSDINDASVQKSWPGFST